MWSPLYPFLVCSSHPTWMLTGEISWAHIPSAEFSRHGFFMLSFKLLLYKRTLLLFSVVSIYRTLCDRGMLSFFFFWTSATRRKSLRINSTGYTFRFCYLFRAQCLIIIFSAVFFYIFIVMRILIHLLDFALEDSCIHESLYSITSASLPQLLPSISLNTLIFCFWFSCAYHKPSYA